MFTNDKHNDPKAPTAPHEKPPVKEPPAPQEEKDKSRKKYVG